MSFFKIKIGRAGRSITEENRPAEQPRETQHSPLEPPFSNDVAYDHYRKLAQRSPNPRPPNFSKLKVS